MNLESVCIPISVTWFINFDFMVGAVFYIFFLFKDKNKLIYLVTSQNNTRYLILEIKLEPLAIMLLSLTKYLRQIYELKKIRIFHGKFCRFPMSQDPNHFFSCVGIAPDHFLLIFINQSQPQTYVWIIFVAISHVTNRSFY